jgi:hypothetical protein
LLRVFFLVQRAMSSETTSGKGKTPRSAKFKFLKPEVRKFATGPTQYPAKRVPGLVPEVEKTLEAVYRQWRGVLWRRQVLLSCKLINKCFKKKVLFFFGQTTYTFFNLLLKNDASILRYIINAVGKASLNNSRINLIHLRRKSITMLRKLQNTVGYIRCMNEVSCVNMYRKYTKSLSLLGEE